MLVKNFSDIFDVAYTARMEEELDEVEEGKLGWIEALKEFYTKFKRDLRIAEQEMADIKGEGIPTEEKCEKCGRPMVMRLGRNGRFLACTGYPECDGTRDLPPELANGNGGAPAKSAVSRWPLSAAASGIFWPARVTPRAGTPRRSWWVAKAPPRPSKTFPWKRSAPSAATIW
jgi:hypothetical protein